MAPVKTPSNIRIAGAATRWLAVSLLITPAANALADAGPASGKLPQPVARVLEAHGLSGSGFSAVVLPIGGGDALVRFNAQVPRNPASTIKLLTTLVALDQLGPAYRWTTRAWLGGPLENGTLRGDLVLEGGGDPYLTGERFWSFVRALRARGLANIEGDLVIDADFFSVPAEDPGAFDGQPYRAYNVAPHAMLVNFKTVRFEFFPAPGSRRVRIVPHPPLANLEIDNRLAAVSGRCRGFQRGISFDAPGGFDGNDVVFSGRFPAACREYSLSRSVLDHERFVFGVFKALWLESGGSIGGSVRSGQAPADDVEPFYEHRSEPLGNVVRAVNKYSNNVMTRHLLLTLGAERYGPPGTTEKGLDALLDWMRAHEIDAPGLKLTNGSGLSRDARMTAATLARLLTVAAEHRYAAEFVASMPVAGEDGTLRRRFRGAPLTGYMHLKTGRLDHVVALAGFVRARSGARYAVVSLHNANDVHRGTGNEVQEALVNWVYDQ